MNRPWFNKDNKYYLIESVKATKTRINELKSDGDWNLSMRHLYRLVIKCFIQLARALDDSQRNSLYK
jgi:hypothetical protein